MGKRIDKQVRLESRRKIDHAAECEESSAPICDCCLAENENTPTKSKQYSKTQGVTTSLLPQAERQQLETNDASGTDSTTPIRELVVIGAGPHALSLLLRLLEPEADFLSDKERHLRADFHQRMRPLAQVRRHLKKLPKGPKETLKPQPQQPQGKSNGKKKSSQESTIAPPPISHETIRQGQIQVVDASGDGWMSHWNQNFDTIQIDQLRSPIGAHADPYDHRALEFYAEREKRNAELVPLGFVPKKIGRWDFHGPFNVPSTSLFSDFHKELATAYGIDDIVQQGRVQSIKPRPVRNGSPKEGALFDLEIMDSQGHISIMTTKRVVCAMGPATSILSKEFFWEEYLKQELRKGPRLYQDYVLHADEIVPWLVAANTKEGPVPTPSSRRLLIVGGGITSGHLALLAAKSSWCSSTTFIQRSVSLERQFDIQNQWMGPARGKLQEDFWSQSPKTRFQCIKTERKGGSITPEVLEVLNQYHAKGQLDMKVEVEIDSVELASDGSLLVGLGEEELQVDMIWLATGFENGIQNYPCLQDLEQILPIANVNGLPCLNKDLSWGSSEVSSCPVTVADLADYDTESDGYDDDNDDNDDDDNSEEAWKQEARQRCWIMGALAAMELGPDAMNLMGGRQGAVRIAQAIRRDFAVCPAADTVSFSCS